MKRSLVIQLKSLFLLLVFSLSALVCFACSVGLDMGSNSEHHESEKRTIAQSHAAEYSKAQDHHSSSGDSNDCCKDGMANPAMADKLILQPVDYTIHPVFFTAFLSALFHVDFSLRNPHTPDNRLFVRCHHPPIANIRVAIQSFQI